MAELFEDIGLTKNEAKAYEALLHLGKASAAQAAKQSGVPYGRIYPVLAGLERKGLARMVPEKTKRYVPTDPERLHQIIEAKKKALDITEEKIRQFKAIYTQQAEEVVQIARGKTEFHRILAEMPKAKKSSYSIKWNFSVSPQFIREVRDLRARKVDYRTLGRVDGETAKNVAHWRRTFPDIPLKHIDNEGVAISIVDDEKLLISMIRSNAILLITDKPFIHLMQRLFVRYYETESAAGTVAKKK